MDRAILERHLAQAEDQVTRDIEHVARQKETVAELEQHSQDASAARELLADLQQIQATHVAHRDRLLALTPGMDRAIFERHLAQAEDEVIQGTEHVARQKETVAELERRGQDASAARELLADLQQAQAAHVAHRDRLRVALTRGGPL